MFSNLLATDDCSPPEPEQRRSFENTKKKEKYGGWENKQNKCNNTRAPALRVTSSCFPSLFGPSNSTQALQERKGQRQFQQFLMKESFWNSCALEQVLQISRSHFFILTVLFTLAFEFDNNVLLN